MEPRVIRESRLKMGGYLAVALGFVAIFAWMAMRPDAPRDDPTGWIGIALFGAGALVFVWLLVRPQVLRLDEAGFVLDGGMVRQPRPVAWADVERFFVYRGPRGAKLIGFNYLPGRAPPSRLRAIARSFGADGGLPRNWTLSPEALVDVLNDYRAKCAPAGASSAPLQPQIVR